MSHADDDAGGVETPSRGRAGDASSVSGPFSCEPPDRPHDAPGSVNRRTLLTAAAALAGSLAGTGAARGLLGSALRVDPRRGARRGPRAQVASVVDVGAGETIQAAVDRAPPGTTVRVPPGTYHETVVIEKPLSLVGSGYLQTHIVADRSRFRWSGRPREQYVVGAVNVRYASDVLIAGFTLVGALEGAWVSASRRVTISDCMSCAHDSSGYYLWGSQACEVVRCEGSDCAVGIYQGGSVDIRIARNVFRHNRGGRVPHLDNDVYPGIGVLIGNVSRGCRVEENLLADNVDWGFGTSLGVSDVTTRANTIRGNATGVFVGERWLSMRNDNVAGNREWGVDSAVGVDAQEVWWGAATGPSGAGPGDGDAVTGPVRFRPWRVAPSPLPPVGPRSSPPVSEGGGA